MQVGWMSGPGLYSAALVILLALFTWYCVAAHYVHDYSDPFGYVSRALLWSQGEDPADRAPLYPVILYQFIRVIGRDWVFISNIPFLLLMLWLVGSLTRVLEKDGVTRPAGASGAGLGPLLAVAILVSARHRLLLFLVNPLREPAAFSLMLASVWLLWSGWQDPRRWWLAGLGGLSLGVSTGIRETSLLLVFPAGFWLFTGLFTGRRFRRLPAAVFAVGLLIGLLPTFFKNYYYSGQALVPAYSASRVAHYTETGSWDIPVPGMSFGYFSRVAPETLRQLFSVYKPAGVILLICGIFRALKSRSRLARDFFLPAAVTYLLFYGFYNRYLPRYLLAAELFAVPIMAYGGVGIGNWLSGFLSRRRPSAAAGLRYFAAAALVIWPGGQLLSGIFRDDVRTRVWHLKTLRSEFLSRIEEPAVFLGHQHFCHRMQWLLDQHSYEYTRTFQQDRGRFDSLDDRLRRQGRETVARFSRGNYYINESNFSLAGNWLRRDPVLAFADLSVPFECLGVPEPGYLYRVRLWQDNRIELRATNPRPAPALLMLDLKRPWDYPGRSFLTGRELPDGETYDLTDAVQFLELPEGASDRPFSFTIESDRPLPPGPYWRLIGLNDEIRLSYGMGADHWAWNFASDDLYPNPAIPFDAGQLYDRGELRLPTFAGGDREVLAEFRFEFMREDPYWQTRSDYLEIDTGSDRGRWRLPPPRRQKRVVVSLGPGRDGLVYVPVTLKTSLPSHKTQNSYPFWSRCRSNGFVKLYDVRIFVPSHPESYPVAADVGSPEDQALAPRGFFGPERSGGYTGRWSSAKGEFRLKLPPAERPLRLTWRVLPLRPDQDEIRPVFSVNERTLPVEGIRRKKDSPVWAYEAVISPGVLQPADWNFFTIEVPTWRPADTGRSGDLRSLGVFIESVILEEIPPAAAEDAGGCMERGERGR